MKGPLDRTKVVLRHLPPTLSQSNLVEHIDSRFSERYHWITFHPGKSSLKNLKHSRAYINFNKSEDVIEFAEFFNGHVFVNEKGTQFKAIVEYAPSQRVPKNCSKKDGREGTLLKDPEYVEFLEYLAKPVENLPSAEIQLERKEAERAGAPKDVPIVTPLMDYVRQKRSAKGQARRTTLNGRSTTRRVGSISSRMAASGSSKKGPGKRSPATMYVLRESSKDVGTKDTSTYVGAVSSTDVFVGGIGGLGSTENGKKKILLLKGKEKEISDVLGGSALQQNAVDPTKNSHTSPPLKQNQQRDVNGRIIRSILLNRDTRQKQPLSGPQPELRILSSNQDRDKRPPRPQSLQSTQKNSNGNSQDKVVSTDLHAIHAEKQERKTRNKDRPDRGVWTPLRRSDGPHASDESLSSSIPQISQVVEFGEGNHADMKQEMLAMRGGSYKPGSRRGSAYSIKDADSSLVEGKSLKKAGSGYGSLEKQVWVQKSNSGS